MAWYVPVLLRIIVAHVFFPWVGKKVVGQSKRTTRFLLTFAFCATVSAV